MNDRVTAIETRLKELEDKVKAMDAPKVTPVVTSAKSTKKADAK